MSDGNAGKQIEISDVKYNVFQVTRREARGARSRYEGCNALFIYTASFLLQMMMSYLYCGGTESLKTNVADLLEVYKKKRFTLL